MKDMPIDIISPVASYFRLKKSVRIYDLIFLLHGKVTVGLLIAFSILVTSKQYFGDPIQCIGDQPRTTFLDTYCWVLGIYRLRDDTRDVVGKTVISHGVRNDYFQSNDEAKEKIFLRYYQWIALLLMLQSIIFHIPTFLWKNWEGGRLQQLCNQLDEIFIPEEWGSSKKSRLVAYFSNDYRNVHTCYALKYFACETLNFLICILNIVCMDEFFSGFWSNYVPALSVIFSHNYEKWDLYSSRIFPKMAKCEFQSYGGSGSIQKINALCVLPLNIINEKIFTFLWFWFIFLTIISGINVIARLLMLATKYFRVQTIRAYARFLSKEQVEEITNGANVGDCFLLYKVGGNINPVLFRELCETLLIDGENPSKKTVSDLE